jgi:hypothetical protein
MNRIVQTQLLKDILENNTLYEVEEIDSKLEYKLNENGEKIRICEIDEIEFDEIKLSNKKYFEFKKGQNKYIVDYAENNKGDIPMLGSSLTNKCIAYYIIPIDEKDVIYSKCITFNKDNAKGSRAFLRDFPFVMDRHHIAILQTELVSINYSQILIDNILKERNFGWGDNVANAEVVKKLSIKIPKEKKLNHTIYSSYKLQQSIAKNIGEKLTNIKLKEQIINKMLKINEMKILNILQFYLTKEIIEVDTKKIKFEQKKLSQIVDITGGNSQYNQDYYTQFLNQGKYPLYTGSKEIVAFIQPINENDVSSIEFCSYNKDNDAGSKAFYHSLENPCIIGGHHNKVIPKENQKINIKYLYYCLDLLFKTNMFYQSQQPIAGKEIIGKFEIYLPSSAETLDIQKEIVDILEKKMEEVKLNNIYLHKINNLLSIAKTSVLKKG